MDVFFCDCSCVTLSGFCCLQLLFQTSDFMEAFGTVNLLQPICAVGNCVSRMLGRSVSVRVKDAVRGLSV